MFSFMNGLNGYNQIKNDLSGLERLPSRLYSQFSIHSHIVRSRECRCHLPTCDAAISHDMLNDCLEDYVDDVVIKFKEERHCIDDLKKAFTRCRLYNSWMKPLKCTFDVFSRKFLGFTVYKKGTDHDPSKAKAV